MPQFLMLQTHCWFKIMVMLRFTLWPMNQATCNWCRTKYLTEMYQEGSIKDIERKQGGSSEKLIIGGPLTKKPNDWKNFLMNDENSLSLWEWWVKFGYQMPLHQSLETGRWCWATVILHSDNWKTVIKNEIQEMFSDQEETDTIGLVLYSGLWHGACPKPRQWYLLYLPTPRIP